MDRIAHTGRAVGAPNLEDVSARGQAQSLKRRLLSGGAWAFGGRVAQALAALATNALLARLLSPQDLGAYFLAFSVVVLSAMVGSLGANQAAVRFVAQSMGLGQFGRARHAAIVVCSIGTLGALGFGGVYLSFGGILIEKLFHAPALSAVTGLVAGWIIVTAIQNLLGETFRGFHDIRFATIFGGLATGILVMITLAVLWVAVGRANLTIILLLAVGSSLTSNLLATWLLRRKLSSLSRRGARTQVGLVEVLGVTWPLFIANVTLFALNQAAIWIMGIFQPQEDVALYGAAARMVALVAMPLLIVNAVVPPLISEMYFQGKTRELEQALRTTATLAGIPASLVLAAFILLGEQIMGLVFGDYYRAGAAVLALLSTGQLVSVWAGSCGLTLMMTGHQRTMMVSALLSGVLLIAGGLWAVQYSGGIGVAGASAAGMILQNFLMLWLVRRRIGIWTHASLSISALRTVFH